MDDFNRLSHQLAKSLAVMQTRRYTAALKLVSSTNQRWLARLLTEAKLLGATWRASRAFGKWSVLFDVAIVAASVARYFSHCSRFCRTPPLGSAANQIASCAGC